MPASRCVLDLPGVTMAEIDPPHRPNHGLYGYHGFSVRNALLEAGSLAVGAGLSLPGHAAEVVVGIGFSSDSSSLMSTLMSRLPTR